MPPRRIDAGQTADFYTNLLGLHLAHTIVQDRVPSTQAYSPHAHIFFEMEDAGHRLELTARTDRPEQHAAFAADAQTTLAAWQARKSPPTA